MRVLAVEDDPLTAERLVSCLRRLGYQANAVETGEEALAAFPQSDLVLLDLKLPDVDGLEVCRGIRAAGGTPVIAFADGGDEMERVLGLQAGADDCMDKPYGLRELTARIDAVMRRVRASRLDEKVVECDGLRVDPTTREVSVDGRPVELTRKEFDLLHVLTAQAGSVVTRQELMSRVWQDNGGGSPRASRTLDTHVATLRQKLGASGWIVTVRGVGFRLGTGEDRRADL